MAKQNSLKQFEGSDHFLIDLGSCEHYLAQHGYSREDITREQSVKYESRMNESVDEAENRMRPLVERAIHNMGRRRKKQ